MQRPLLTLALIAGLAGCNNVQPPPPPMKPPEVVVGRSLVDRVTDFEEFQGKTEAVKAVDVRAHVSGYLDRYNFKDGAEVRENDVLFEIDPRPFKAELDRADANVGLGNALGRRGDVDGAIAAYRRVLEVRPEEG